MNQHTGALWDQAAMDRLALLWGRNQSCSEIARDLSAFFHRKFSRCSITGKARRLGLPSRPSPIINAGAPLNLTPDEMRVRKNAAKRNRNTAAGKKPKPSAEERAQKAAEMAAQPKPTKARNVASFPPAPKKTQPEPDEHHAGNMTLLEAQERDGCRWPYNHRPNFTFCGQPRAEPTEACQRPPYCPTHAQLATRPLQPARVAR